MTFQLVCTEPKELTQYKSDMQEAFQSVHHVVFILCYTVLEDFLFLVFSLIRVHKSIWEDIT